MCTLPFISRFRKTPSVFHVVASTIVLDRTAPLALHQVVVVSPGKEAVIRLRGYDLDGDDLVATITSTPSSGALHQVSDTAEIIYGILVAAAPRAWVHSLRPTFNDGGTVHRTVSMRFLLACTARDVRDVSDGECSLAVLLLNMHCRGYHVFKRSRGCLEHVLRS